MSRFFVGYSGARGPPSTILLSDVKADTSLEALIDTYIAQYSGMGLLDPTLVTLSTSPDVDANGVRGGEQVLRYCKKVGELSSYFDEFAKGDGDLYLVDCEKRERQAVPARTATSTAKSTTTATPTAAATTTTSKSAAPTASDDFGAEIKKVISDAKALYKNKQYKQAREAVSNSMKVLNRKQKRDVSLCEMMAEILKASRKYDEATDYAENAVEINSSQGTLATGSTRKYLCYLCATVHYEAGNYEDSYAYLKSAFDAIGASNAKRPASTPASASSKLLGVKYTSFHLDLAALQAEVLFAIGRHTEAADVVNGCMADPNCEKNLGVLCAYAHFAAQYGKVEEAVRSLLKTVTISQADKKPKRILAKLLDSSAAITALTKELPVSETSSAAYGFLAIICKDFSSLNASRQLLQFALQGKPGNPSYLLNLVHILELQGKFDEALAAVESFCTINRHHVKVGSDGYNCQDLLDAMQNDSNLLNDVEEEETVGYVCTWVDNEGACDGKGYGYVVTSPLSKSSSEYAIGPYSMSPAEVARLYDNQQVYDGDSLDLLALGFTIIKMYYLQGKLHKLPVLFDLIESSRLKSSAPIHETNVRNEHAYYQCIAQVLSYRLQCTQLAPPSPESVKSMSTEAPAYLHTIPTILPEHVCGDIAQLSQASSSKEEANMVLATAMQKPLYLVGDSHVIPLAWSILTIDNEPKMCIPKLVTGLKHYHLRNESDFYPKAQFNQVIRSVPDSSDVMFICGEIDCREGILIAVEKDAYSSISSGMEKTIGHFMALMPNLVKKRKMNVYIHPVLPMLVETKPLVFSYNELYQKAVSNVANVHWLDFFQDLVSQGGDEQMLLPGLKMDGTHITPAYLPLVERCINGVNK